MNRFWATYFAGALAGVVVCTIATMLIRGTWYSAIMLPFSICITAGITAEAYKQAKRALPLLALLLLPLTADAGSIPLATFSWSQPQPVSLPAQYSATLRIYHGGPIIYTPWTETVTDFPYNSLAPQDIVDRYNQELYQADNGELVFGNAGQHYGNCGWCQLHWLIGEDDRFDAEIAAAGFSAEMFVPRLGPHLIGYLVTGIERTVTATTQTITLHGIPIPEPAGWLLMLCGCVLHFNKRLAPS